MNGEAKMNKRHFFIAVATAFLLTESAFAATGSEYAQSTSQVSACQLAKIKATRSISQVSAAGEVKRAEHIGECSCDKMSTDYNEIEHWECTVSWGVDIEVR
jgi:hypothetical protein